MRLQRTTRQENTKVTAITTGVSLESMAEIVGAEWMAPGRAVEMGSEIDIVDRHLPDKRAERHRQRHQAEDRQASNRQAVTAKAPPCFAAGRDMPRPTGRDRRRARGASDRRCEGRASHKGCRRQG